MTAVRVPTVQVFFTLSHCPAPTFWAHMVDMELPIATAGMMANPLNFPTTPTAADAFTPPMEFTRVVMIRKEKLVTPFWMAAGVPILKIIFSSCL